MELSKDTQEHLHRATTSFGDEVAGIIGQELTQRNAVAVQEAQAVLGRLLNGHGDASRSLTVPAFRATRMPTKQTRGKVFRITEPAMQKLVSLIAAQGGAAEPKAVSKAFKLSPDQRRRFVAEAAKAGLVKVTGSRRTTRYVLTARKKRKSKKVTRRKTARKKTTRRKAIGRRR